MKINISEKHATGEYGDLLSGDEMKDSTIYKDSAVLGIFKLGKLAAFLFQESNGGCYLWLSGNPVKIYTEPRCQTFKPGTVISFTQE